MVATAPEGRRTECRPDCLALPLGRRQRAGEVTFPAQVAQLVEHFHGKEGVTSSSLVLGFRKPCNAGLSAI